MDIKSQQKLIRRKDAPLVSRSRSFGNASKPLPKQNNGKSIEKQLYKRYYVRCLELSLSEAVWSLSDSAVVKFDFLFA